MDKLIELIEKHRDKWQKKWFKGTQLRDSNSEYYDQFLHGESVGATRAYNNVLQWMKGSSIMSREPDLALTWEDMALAFKCVNAALDDCDGKTREEVLKDALRRFNELKKK